MEMIESLYILGRIPEMFLFTVSIPSIKMMCLELSPEVKSSIPILHEKVGQLVHKIGLLTI